MDSEPRKRRDSLDEPEGEGVSNPGPPSPPSGDESGKVLAYLLLYSMAMFTLPFLAFIGTKYGLKHFGIEGFANTAWSVVSVVLVVNVIIFMYVCKGYHDDIEPLEKEKKSDKTDLNLKTD